VVLACGLAARRLGRYLGASETVSADHVNRQGIAGIVNRDVIQRAREALPVDELEDLKQAPLSFRLIKRLLGYTRPYKSKLRWLLVCVFARGVQLPVLAWAIGAVMNGPVARRDTHGLDAGGAGVLLASPCSPRSPYRFRVKFSQQLGEYVVHDIRRDLFRHWLRLTMSYFQSRPVGRLISRLTGDAENVRVGVQNVLFVSLVQTGQMLGCAVLMACTDVWLFVCALGVAPFVWLLNRIFRKRLSAAYRAQSDSFSRISATMAESVSGVRVTQSFVARTSMISSSIDLVEDHARYNFDAAKAGGQFVPALELCSQAFLAALLVIGGYRALQPDIAMPVGRMIQFFFLAGLFFQPITVLGQLFNEALTAMAGAEKLFHVLDTQPAWTDDETAERSARLRGAVQFDEVWFEYQANRAALAGHCVQGGARDVRCPGGPHWQRQDHARQLDREVPFAHSRHDQAGWPRHSTPAQRCDSSLARHGAAAELFVPRHRAR